LLCFRHKEFLLIKVKTHVRSQKSLINNFFRKGIAMKRTIISAMAIALIFGLSSFTFADEYANLMTTAKNSLKAKMYGEARENAEKALALRQNGDPEAFALLGDIYFAQMAYDQAMKNWQNAFLFKIKNPEKRKAEIVGNILAIIRSTSPGISEAKIFFNYAQEFGCSEATIAKEKMAYGKRKLLAVKNREEALAYTFFVGQDLIDKAFPPAQIVTVFEKSYTFADAFNEYGQIHTFKFVDDGVNVGDKVEVIAKPIDGGEFSGEEIGIWQGEKFDPPWDRTTNGYYSSIVEVAPQGKKFTISLCSRKDLRVLVRVTREVTPDPNRDFLAFK